MSLDAYGASSIQFQIDIDLGANPSRCFAIKDRKSKSVRKTTDSELILHRRIVGLRLFLTCKQNRCIPAISTTANNMYSRLVLDNQHMQIRCTKRVIYVSSFTVYRLETVKKKMKVGNWLQWLKLVQKICKNKKISSALSLSINIINEKLF